MPKARGEPSASAQSVANLFGCAFAALVEHGPWRFLLRANGMQVCLTDGLPPMSMTLLLEQLGWRALVDLAVAPGPGVRGFPWPDIALTAALRLGLDAVSRLAVVGDTTSDLLGGTRAGASVVAGVVTGAHSVEQLATAPHTHVFPSVADVAATLSGRAVPVS